jgi:hypothetical protein
MEEKRIELGPMRAESADCIGEGHLKQRVPEGRRPGRVASVAGPALEPKIPDAVRPTSDCSGAAAV